MPWDRGAGAATAAIDYLSDVIGSGRTAGRGSAGSAILGTASLLPQITPYARYRDPKTICGIPGPFSGGMEYGFSYGYQCGRQSGQRHAGGGRSRSEKKGFNFSDFVKNVVAGAVTGGIFGLGFYGAKVVGSWRKGIYGNEGDISSV